MRNNVKSISEKNKFLEPGNASQSTDSSGIRIVENKLRQPNNFLTENISNFRLMTMSYQIL